MNYIKAKKKKKEKNNEFCRFSLRVHLGLTMIYICCILFALNAWSHRNLNLS